MAQNFWSAIWAWTICFVVTLVVSLVTAPKPEANSLAWSTVSRRTRPRRGWRGISGPAPLALCVLLLTAAVNVIFW